VRDARARSDRGRPGAASAAVRAALFGAGWWLLTEGRGGIAAGLVVAAAATVASLRLAPGRPPRLKPVGVARFVPYFLWHSLRGGIDVAWRALHPALPIQPDMREVELRLPPGPARTFFAGVVSLLPGTLSVHLGERALAVHVLSGGDATVARLRELETMVGSMFGHVTAGGT
jgi:multicomponent Na+:H+ antiporter subunit E